MQRLKATTWFAWLFLFGTIPLLAEVNIYVADHHNKTVIKIKEDGTLLWAFPNNNGHDVQLLKNGNILIVRGTPVTATMLEGVALSLIVRAGAGYNTIDVAAASRRVPTPRVTS
jgi:phosphoglycerate dehydrogenase-like enzyme